MNILSDKELKVIYDEYIELDKNRELEFNEKWNKMKLIKKPLEEWAEFKLDTAMKNHPTHSGLSGLHKFCREGDNALCVVMRKAKDEKWDKEKEKEENMKVMTYYEDDVIGITCIIDYDYGYIICKYCVTNKVEKFKCHDAKMLAKDN